MNPFTALIANQHLDDLRREAAASRLARATRDSHAAPVEPSAWSRLVGRSARGLSAALDGVASRLDPVQPSDDGGARPVAA